MNILDYLDWRGDITFVHDSFNLVDNLILSELIYLNFDNVLINKSYTLEDLANIFQKDKGNISFEEMKIECGCKPIILYKLAHSKRFKDIIIHNYVSKYNEEDIEQFAACTFDLSDGTIYIAFRGTDETAIGWHENFIFTYTETKGQIEAIKYLENNNHLFKKIRVGGHSKGGYLATYAAIKAKRSIKNKIINIYSNDGPGLRPGSYCDEDISFLKDKYIKIIPEDDIIGMAFDDNLNNFIIKTDKNGILSHDGFSWLVFNNHFIEGKLTPKAISLKNAFEQFIIETSEEDRKNFANEVFNILKDNDIALSLTVDVNNITKYLKALKSLSGINASSRSVAGKFIKIFSSYYEEKINDFITKIDFRKKS